jgi:hypothetical protein
MDRGGGRSNIKLDLREIGYERINCFKRDRKHV